MYLVWVVMHLVMGTICAGGRLSPSSSLTPTNFTRLNCLDFLWFFWQLIIPRTNDPKTSVVSLSSHFSGQSWQIAVARPPCTHSLAHSLNWTKSTFALFAHTNKSNRHKKYDFGVSLFLGDLFARTTQKETSFTQEYNLSNKHLTFFVLFSISQENCRTRIDNHQKYCLRFLPLSAFTLWNQWKALYLCVFLCFKYFNVYLCFPIPRFVFAAHRATT